MEVEPRTAAGRAGLAAVRADPGRALVATDYDGTLAPIVDDPDAARPAPGLDAALDGLLDRVGTVAVVTGRPPGTVVRLAGLTAYAGRPGLVVLGHYGAERWDAATGTYAAAAVPPGLATVRDRLPALLRAAGAPDGTAIEDKGVAVAVHVRTTADPGTALARLREPLAGLAAETGLHLEPGRAVLELRAEGGDKGAALRRLVAERDAAAVVYAGDDLGDLAAYDAVEALRGDGVPGLTVGCRGPEPVDAVADRADVLLPDPAAVVAYLRALPG